MFQNFVHRASVDPSAPYLRDVVSSDVVVTVLPDDVVRSSSAYFATDADVPEDWSCLVHGLRHLPDGSCLSVNVGCLAKPVGLTSCHVTFADSSGSTLAVMPLMGNGLGVIQDVVDIPVGATQATVFFYGMLASSGHIRAVSREAIPYQPLKG